MSEGYEKHTDFYNMVKEWTVSDYCTPGIKAEVILDMLISDFIEELIQYHYFNTEHRTYSATLLAKEFPIRTSDKNLRNARVDYLMYVHNAEEEKLVLVELKSTNDSFDREQMKRMKDTTKENAKELIDFYNIIYDKLVNHGKGNLSDRIKYQYSYDRFPENWKKDALEEKRMIRKLDLKQNTGKSNIKTDYLYIFLTDNVSLTKEELPMKKRLILIEYCRNNKKFEKFLKNKERAQLWKSVSDILRACMEKWNKGQIEFKKNKTSK